MSLEEVNTKQRFEEATIFSNGINIPLKGLLLVITETLLEAIQKQGINNNYFQRLQGYISTFDQAIYQDAPRQLELLVPVEIFERYEFLRSYNSLYGQLLLQLIQIIIINIMSDKLSQELKVLGEAVYNYTMDYREMLAIEYKTYMH